MKKDILKIAGVKSEKEFYKKFPTEEAFMKAHGKEFKKAKMGASMVKKQLTQLTDFSNPPEAQLGKNIPSIGVLDGVNKYNALGQQQNAVTVPKIVSDFAKSQREEGKGLLGVGAGESGSSNFDITPYEGAITSFVQGLAQIPQEMKEIKKSRTSRKLAELQGLALDSQKSQRIKNQHITPWDNPVQPGQLGSPYGTGYEILYAQDGASLSNRVMGGVPGEIMNTYDPNTIYSDLGYEPLEDSEKVKQFKNGGIRKASVGSSVGKGLGTAVGTYFGGPIGGALGGELGGFLGEQFDPAAAEEKRKQQALETLEGKALNAAFLQKNSSSFEDGGQLSDYEWVSHTWQPQVIAKFGDHDVNDLLKPDPTMDTLRTGGNIRQNNMSELDSYAFGGDLKIEGRGDIEFMGYNPETAKSGANGYIGISRGPSHDDGGFNIDYGGNKVEIEGNETVLEKRDGGSVNGKNSLIIFGDMKYGKMGESIMQDVNSKMLKSLTKGKDIKDVKFKHLGNAVAKKTKQLNKAEDKYIDLINSSNSNSIFDTLAMNSAKAALNGIDQSYKILDDIQNKSVNLQTAYHDTAKEFNYEDTPKFLKDIEKGKLTMAKLGGKISTAQNGDEFGLSVWEGNKQGLGKKTASAYTLKQWNEIAKKLGFKGKGNKELQKFLLENPKTKEIIAKRHNELYGKDPFIDDKLGYGWSADFSPVTNQVSNQAIDTTPIQPQTMNNINLGVPPIEWKFRDKGDKKGTEKKRNNWDRAYDLYNEVLPFIRPSNAKSLDPRSYTGEILTLAGNQPEGVHAQKYIPELATPTSVSYKDIFDANQADYNAMQRLVGGNPAALSILNAQKYAANQKVLGEQFRANQAEKQRVQDMNRNLLNNAYATNLDILDTQYDRQNKAASATKQAAIAAINSMNSKYLQNELENKALQTYENEYNYRFGPGMKAINMNPLAKFNIPDVAINDAYENDNGDIVIPKSNKFQNKASKSKSTTARNGSIVKALKNL